VINPKLVLFGEIGLTGEVRAISQPELRVKEAARLGFSQCILPQGNLKNLDVPKNIKLIGVKHASEALDLIFI
jgi:DNA repair protein RadA/Sms